MQSPFSFRGRTGRLAYAAGMLVCGLVAPVFLIVGSVVAVPWVSNGWRFLAAIVILITYTVAMIWVTLALQARRSRDIGWNPNLAVLGYVGIWLLSSELVSMHRSALWVCLAANIVFFIVLAIRPAQQSQSDIQDTLPPRSS